MRRCGFRRGGGGAIDVKNQRDCAGGREGLVYGLVNRAIEEMVRRDHGDALWEDVRKRAGVDEAAFVSNESYPDDMTYALVAAASEISGESTTHVLQEFGRYWVRDTAVRHYGYLMRASGHTLREFLLNLPNFHTRVTLMLPKLVPPEFDCTEVAEKSLNLHYRSRRDGLVPFVEGLLHGLAELFGTTVELTHRPDLSTGRGHAVIRVAWQ
jgi:hypothetical protein